MKLLVPWLRKSGFWGHSRSPDPKFGVFVVTQGQNIKIFKPTFFGILGLGLIFKNSSFVILGFEYRICGF